MLVLENEELQRVIALFCGIYWIGYGFTNIGISRRFIQCMKKNIIIKYTRETARMIISKCTYKKMVNIVIMFDDSVWKYIFPNWYGFSDYRDILSKEKNRSANILLQLKFVLNQNGKIAHSLTTCKKCMRICKFYINNKVRRTLTRVRNRAVSEAVLRNGDIWIFALNVGQNTSNPYRNREDRAADRRPSHSHFQQTLSDWKYSRKPRKNTHGGKKTSDHLRLCADSLRWSRKWTKPNDCPFWKWNWLEHIARFRN